MAAFHASRVEWSYISDYAWVKEVTSRGYVLTGALNTALPDELAAPGEKQTYARELLPESADGVWKIRIPDFSIHGILHIAPSR